MNATQDHSILPLRGLQKGSDSRFPHTKPKLHLRCSTDNLYRLVLEVRRQPHLSFFNLLYLLRQAFLGVQFTH